MPARRFAWLAAGVVAYALAMIPVVRGCGYFQAGTWLDDPKNWERAFGDAAPEGLEVVHSYYGRSHHWTFEYEAFFQVRATPARAAALLSAPWAHRVSREDEGGLETSIPMGPEVPRWFAPGDRTRYEGYIIYEGPERRKPILLLLRDPASGALFLYSSQV